MITHGQNEYLCRTGPGTPMGELFRRYWVPALMREEVPRPNCPPVQVQLLGERLIAFRDTQGRLGLMDEFCAHRGTSLWFGRNGGRARGAEKSARASRAAMSLELATRLRGGLTPHSAHLRTHIDRGALRPGF